MYKKLVISAVVLAIALPAFAQTDGGEQYPVTGPVQGGVIAPKGMPRPRVRNGVAPIRRQMNGDANAVRQGVKTEIENERASMRGEVEKERDDVSAERQAAMQALQVQVKAVQNDTTLTAEQKKAKLEALRASTMQVRQDDMKKFIQDRQRAMKDFKAKADAARAKLKTQVKGIKDAAKQKVALTLADNLNNVNKKLTDQMSENLTKIGAVLRQISDKTNSLSAAGTDVAAAETAITTAQVAIAAAQTAVTTQTGNVYTLTTATTDATAKADFTALRQKLQADIEAVQKLMTTARDDVRAAGQALRATPGANVEASERS